MSKVNSPDQTERLWSRFEELIKIVLPFVDRFMELDRKAFPDLDRQLKKVADALGSEGVDPFGMDPTALRQIARVALFFYRLYFRAETEGIENVPEGPAILVANHGGQLPFDAVMIGTSLLVDGKPPRLVRSTADRWVPSLPFVSTLYSRMGMVVGTPENTERLIAEGSLLLMFPEGLDAVTKTIENAYALQPFNPYFVRLALAQKVPIIPVAVLGHEEQYPTLYNLKGVAKVLGLPSFPLWLQMPIPLLGLLPLPVKYRLQFGEPMWFEGDPDDNDEVIDGKVEQVRTRLQEMVGKLRARRKGVFS